MIERSPLVSVIICAYSFDRLKDVVEAVNSVLVQTIKPDEIIVAVDHNKGLLQELRVQFPAIVKLVLNQGARGLSETRNVGIRASLGEIIAFMDDDAQAREDWLHILVRHFECPQVVAVGGRVIAKWQNGKRPAWFPEELDWIIGCTYKGLPLKGKEVRNVIGCNMAFRKGVFDQVGLFRIEMGRTGKTRGVAEESELCVRIKQRMPLVNIIYEPDSIVYHKVPAWRLSTKYIVQRSYDEGFYKSLLKKMFLSSNRNSLGTEGSYLRYLLSNSLPREVRAFYRAASLLRAATIMLSIVSVGTGYLLAKRKKLP